MKSKILAFIACTIILATLALAAFSVSPTSLTFTPSTNSSQFTITNPNASTLLTVNMPSQAQVRGENGYIGTFTISGSPSNINASSPRVFTVTPQSVDFSKYKLEQSYTGSFNVTEGSSVTPITIVVQNQFCKAGVRGDLSIETDIVNNGAFGEDDEWYPFDEIEVEATVENTGNDDIDEVIVSWGLYNTRTGEFVIDDEEKSVDIKDDDEEIVTFTFTLDPEDIDPSDAEGDFVFFVKAYSDDLGEDEQCDFVKDDIKVVRNNDFVIIGDLNIADTLQCGETINVGADAWNIGDSDQDDVYVTVFNKALGLNNKRIELGDIDELDNKKFSFDLEVPRNMTTGAQILEFKVYDEDDDIFENDNGDEAVIRKSVTIEGNCEVPKSVDVSASLTSEAVAGKDMTVKVSLRNSGTTQTTYQVLLANYDSWATLKSIEPRTTTLNAGESKDVIITLTPNKGSEGNKEFAVQAVYNGLITEQRISVPVEASSSFITGFSISNITGSGNWFIWVIAALNIILVVLIVVIAVRIAKK